MRLTPNWPGSSSGLWPPAIPEWIAAQVFGIELEASAVAAGIDGRFGPGPLQGQTVNIKWYLKREGLLDTTESTALDYYLVLTGPPATAASSRGTTRPWSIQAVFLFDARQLRSEQITRECDHLNWPRFGLLSSRILAPPGW
jgi:hypothetical protein